MKILIYLFCAATLSSCAHSIHDVYVSDFGGTKQMDANQIIQAKTEQFVILGFTKETDYVNQAYVSLQSKCSGEIVGISTQLSSSLGFLSWTNKALMQGFCLNK